MSTTPSLAPEAQNGASRPAERTEPTVPELHYYGSASVNNGLMGEIGVMLAPIILVMYLEINPAWIGVVVGARILIDAITDPVMAYITDNHRGRMGRRRPFILAGGILLGFFAIATWSLPPFLSPEAVKWWFAVGTILTALSWTVFAVPHFALGIELSPSYHGRTRVAVYKGFYERLAGLVVPWFFAFVSWEVWGDPVMGGRVLVTLLVCFTLPTAVICALKTRERSGWTGKTSLNFFSAVLTTIRNVHFLRIAAIFVILLFTFGLLESFGLYLINYYIFEGDLQRAGVYFGIQGTITTVMSFLALPFISYLSKRIQKHNTLKVSLWLMIVGSLLHLVLMDPERPWLLFIIPLFYGFGISCIFTIMPALQADVVDFDEVKTGERREGMFGAAASLMMKSAAAIATAISGFLVVLLGFDPELREAQVPGAMERILWVNAVGQAGLVSLALLLLRRYPLTEERVDAVRDLLAKRHAKERAADDAADGENHPPHEA